jgi:energy-coupling factor transporter ATP-binding protein EcfA2
LEVNRLDNPLTLFKDALPKIFFSELTIIRSEVEIIFENPILRHFTDHSVSHSDRMTRILFTILTQNQKNPKDLKLNDNEIYILLLAIYLHDISMQIPKAFGIKKEITDYTNEEYNFIRQNHGEVSAEILNDIIKKEKDEYKLCLNINKKEIKPFIPVVCQLCCNHQSKKEYDSNEIIAVRGDQARIGILTGLLRIVDQLDCDCRRVDMDKLDQYNISLESKLHWITCHYIDIVNIKNGNIEIFASFPESLSSSIINYISGALATKINSELEICADELWKNGIFLRFNGKIFRQKWDLSGSKMLLSEDIQKIIREKLVLEKPQHIVVKKEENLEKIDWLSYWRLIGSPFLDQPLSYGSEYFVETKKFKKIISEIDSLINANQGDIKLLVGERGLGKTTLFEILKGKFKDKLYVETIDVADLITGVNNATELYIKLFTSINNILFKYDTEQFNKDKFLSKINKGKVSIICIDSLDRLPPEKDQILKDFFRQSQHILTQMKKNILLILSCADRWMSFLNSIELSYLGAKNQWTLDKFQTEEIREMLDKRLISAGRAFSEIFDENCIIPIQLMSGGNPRQVLINAENVCRFAQDENIEKIDARFFEKKYKNFFEEAYTQLINEQSQRLPTFKEGLNLLYCYYCEMERRNLDTNIGFDFLTQLTATDIKQSTIRVQYQWPLKYVSKIVTKKEKEIFVNYFTLHDSIIKLFEVLKKSGYSAKGFLSFYTISPEKFIPAHSSSDIINEFKKYIDTSEDVGYYEQARIEYIDTIKNIKIGHLFIRKSWDIIENMMVAILINMEKLNLQKYEEDKNKIFRIDDLGRKLYMPGSGRMQSDQSKEIIELFKESINQKHIYMIHYPSAQWIRLERANIVKGRTESYSKYGEKSIEICRNHLYLSYKELLEIYDRVRNIKKL